MSNARPLSRSKQWISILLGWVAFALFDAARTVGVMKSEGMHHNWPVLFVIEALSWLPWAVFTMIIIAVARRLRGVRWPIALGTHLAVGIGAGLLSSWWQALLVHDFQPFGPPTYSGFVRSWQIDFYDGLVTTVVFYASILMLQAVLDSRERLASHNLEVARLNEQLAQAHLHALRRQIEPHFLFNALNSVAGLVREGRNDAAVSMIANLGDFLRRTLADSSVQEVTLFEELEFVAHYLAIQKVRFADRLQLDVAIAPELHRAAVPSLLLQPLVENAIDHGIAKRKDGGTVRIAACVHENQLVINITDNSVGLQPDRNGREPGIGISNVRARLKTLYGERSTFDLRARDGGGVEVAIAIPLRLIAV